MAHFVLTKDGYVNADMVASWCETPDSYYKGYDANGVYICTIHMSTFDEMRESRLVVPNNHPNMRLLEFFQEEDGSIFYISNPILAWRVGDGVSIPVTIDEYTEPWCLHYEGCWEFQFECRCITEEAALEHAAKWFAEKRSRWLSDTTEGDTA